jgi:hypothetical protein
MTARKERPVPEREQRFVEAFAASGNATHSARVAGYTGSDETLGVTGSKLLKKARVATAIAELSRKRTRATEVTRERRLEVLSQIVEGEILAPIGIANGKPVYGPPSHDARRKAAMDIARMRGELIEKHDVQVDVNAKSVHVVLMVPASPHASAEATAAAVVPAAVDAVTKPNGGDDGRS